jgi:hypothetical protein
LVLSLFGFWFFLMRYWVRRTYWFEGVPEKLELWEIALLRKKAIPPVQLISYPGSIERKAEAKPVLR